MMERRQLGGSQAERVSYDVLCTNKITRLISVPPASGKAQLHTIVMKDGRQVKHVKAGRINPNKHLYGVEAVDIWPFG